MAEKCTNSPVNYKMFGLSLQALIVLSNKESTCPSCDIAKHLQSEATQLRRILAKLVRGGLLQTREGRDGGYKLCKHPQEITLADVYLALQVEEPLCNGLMQTTGTHPFGLRMNTIFERLKEEVDQSVLQVLSKYTIADLLTQMEHV